MSQHVKTVVAAIAAVLLAGVQAWQTAVDGRPFRAVDALPIAIAVAGAVLVHVIPNTGDQPVAKAIVAGVLAALNGASTVLAGDPASVTMLNLAVAALGALVTWYVPELVPELGAAKAAADIAVKARSGQPVDAGEITDALRQIEDLDPTVTAKNPTTGMRAPVTEPTTAAIPVQAPRPATTAVLAAMATEPTPIADAALAAAHTAALPAVPNANMAG